MPQAVVSYFFHTTNNAELVFVVSGTTNMYPGYGIVYKNVPVLGSLPEYVPCAYCSVP